MSSRIFRTAPGIHERVVHHEGQLCGWRFFNQAQGLSEVDVIGFSSSTCLPALSASMREGEMRTYRRRYGHCIDLRVREQIPVVFRDLNAGVCRCTAARRSLFMSATAITWVDGHSKKFRTRLGPQKP